MSDFNACKEKYRQHLSVLRFAPETVKRYIYFLNRFFAWLEIQGVAEIGRVTKDMVQDYQAHLYETVNSRGEPNSVFHQNNALKAMKSLFRFLVESNCLSSDPTREVSYARTPKRLPRSILTGQEAKKIIHAPNTSTATGYRDRTMMEVLYSTGMRRSELINLRVSDVDYHGGFVRINSGKGNKDRVVPVGRIACRYLENYITAVRPLFSRNPAENHLFLTINGTEISRNRVWQLIKIYSKKNEDRQEHYDSHLPAYLRHAHAQEQGEHQAHSGAPGPLLAGVNPGIHIGNNNGPQGSAQQVPPEGERQGIENNA